MFNDVDTPRIGSKRTRGSSPRYKKLFCLRCMVSYSKDCLHICHGQCQKCLKSIENHMTDYAAQEVFCDDCGRGFDQEFVFENHKIQKLKGEFKSYCEFLHALWSCDEYRKDIVLTMKCSHFGKKRRTFGRNVYFSNSALRNSGPSKYVKCGYCSDYFVKGFSNHHSCFLKRTDSLLGDANKWSRTIHASNVFFMTLRVDLRKKLNVVFKFPMPRPMRNLKKSSVV